MLEPVSSPKILMAREQAVSVSDRPLIMGILNVTPDSFWDGGRYLDPEAALDHAHQMVEEGADVLDIGGESSRPGSLPISGEEELKRLLPVLKLVGTRIKIPLSIDTTKSDIAQRALDLGASIINDVSGLCDDPAMASVVAHYRAGVVLMHRLGPSRTMQHNPQYSDVVEAIAQFLKKQILVALRAGIHHDQIILDPGIGFGKTVEHNLTILSRIGELTGLGRPIVLGVSRKAFIGRVLEQETGQCLTGTIAAVVVALMRGVRVFRVHDVGAVRQAVTMAEAIIRQEAPSG